jgi:hypothetical protein
LEGVFLMALKSLSLASTQPFGLGSARFGVFWKLLKP